jgi:poly(3-hydroxybutyrate) depolymerase
VLAAASILALFTAPPAVAGSDDTAGGGGRVEQQTYRASTGVNDYLVYVPQGWKKTDKLPLYVMVHGCGTTAEQQMHANLLNSLADRERFIVAYPDNGGQCWRALANDKASTTRGGGGDADIIAGITREVISQYHANADRVYLAGMSSGAFQTSATGAAYPDLYAAIGVSAGGGYGMDFLTCMVLPDSAAPLYAPQTVAQMGSRAHVMPFFSIGGTRDPLGEQPSVGGCARLASIEWLATNNLLKPGTNGDTFRDDPTSTTQGQVPGGYSWTTKVARDTSGCEIAQRWIVDGMVHFWSGGTTDPKYAGVFNDPKGPSASEASWRFFKQFTLSRGNTACHR